MNGLQAKPVRRAQLFEAVAANIGAETGEPCPIDETILDELRSIIGDHKVLALVDAFRPHLTAVLAIVEKNNADKPRMSQQLHDIVSLGGSLGLIALTDGAKALEEALRSGVPEIATLRQAFIRQCEEALDALDSTEGVLRQSWLADAAYPE